ncbi:MAG: thiaminase II [Proteobacteria bacterium]|nr:thiaminase II [Pseudomonadota bacterium]
MTTELWAKGGLAERLVAACGPAWNVYVGHEFVRALGAGTLPVESFRHYLKQDYLFLMHYARAWSLAVFKSSTLAEMRKANGTVKAILDKETSLHVEFCRGWGLSEADMEATPEDDATMSYTRYVLDKGFQGDLLDLVVALAPCSLGYAAIGRKLIRADIAANPYRAWIETYGSEDFAKVARANSDEIDRLWKVRANEGRFDDLVKTFDKACRLEAAFWQMGLDA